MLNSVYNNEELTKDLKGDFDVLELHSINGPRYERSRLKLGEGQSVSVNTEVDAGKTVSSVSYMDSNKKLHPVKFTQKGNKVSFRMSTVGINPIVVKYGKAPVKDSFSKKKPSIKVKKSKSKNVSISWKKVPKAKGYKIYRKDGKSKKYKLVKIVRSSKINKYVNKNLKSGRTYSYKMRAYKKDGKKTINTSYSKAKTVNIA